MGTPLAPDTSHPIYQACHPSRWQHFTTPGPTWQPTHRGRGRKAAEAPGRCLRLAGHQEVTAEALEDQGGRRPVEAPGCPVLAGILGLQELWHHPETTQPGGIPRHLEWHLGTQLRGSQARPLTTPALPGTREGKSPGGRPGAHSCQLRVYPRIHLHPHQPCLVGWGPLAPDHWACTSHRQLHVAWTAGTTPLPRTQPHARPGTSRPRQDKPGRWGQWLAKTWAMC